MRIENLSFEQALAKLKADDGKIGTSDFPINYYFFDDDRLTLKSSTNVQVIGFHDLVRNNWFWEPMEKETKLKESDFKKAFSELLANPEFSDSERRKIERLQNNLEKTLGFKKK